MLFFCYIAYIGLLLLLIFALLQILIHNFVSIPNSKLVEKLDILLLHKEGQERQIAELQEQLSLILSTIQKPSSSEVAFGFLSDNSSLCVGLVFFIFSSLLLNYSVKFDPQFIFRKLLRYQKTQQNLYVDSITKLYLIIFNRLAKDMGSVVVNDNFVSSEHFLNELGLVFYKLTKNDQTMVINICIKINELTLKSQSINSEIAQILEFLSR